MPRRSFHLIISITLYIANSSLVYSFAPLGSEPVDKCYIHSYECPSHYVCVIDNHNKDPYDGHCICDRFYGFYGPTCEKISVGSYLLGIVCILCFILALRALYLNLEFVYQLIKRGSLKYNTLCICLFFNMVSVLPVFGWSIGFFVGVTSIDAQMVFHQYIRSSVYMFSTATFVLSTMSISLAWIETVEKIRAVPNYHWKYKFALFSTSAFALLISFISFRYSMTELVGTFEGIAVFFSYFQGKYMVTEALSVMEENGDVVVYQGSADLLYTIKQTAKKMMIYSLLVSLSFFVGAFTMTMSIPKYKEQDHLPRYAQGQLCFLMIGICAYQINITLLDYLKSCAKRQLARPPVNRTSWHFCSCVLCFCFCCCEGGNTSDYHLHQQLVELPVVNSDGVVASNIEEDTSLQNESTAEKSSSGTSSSDDSSKINETESKRQHFDGSRVLLRRMLNYMFSNNNNGIIRDGSQSGFPKIAVGQKSESQKAVVPDDMFYESSMISSITEPSYYSPEEGPELGLGTLRRLIHNTSPVDFDDGDDELHKVSVGLNHLPLIPFQEDNQTSLSMAQVPRQQRISVVDFDADNSNDDMSSITMPEALKASKSNDISCLVPHACLDNKSVNTSVSTSISALTPSGPPPLYSPAHKFRMLPIRYQGSASDVSSITSSSSDTPPAVVPRFYSNRLTKLSPLPTSTNFLQPSVSTTGEDVGAPKELKAGTGSFSDPPFRRRQYNDEGGMKNIIECVQNEVSPSGDFHDEVGIDF